jgi:putative component of membrane protein insertase Oxa1/YidC/SpoIIIJ protein YidD
MYLTGVESITRRTAIDTIRFYQRRISPHKGFSCPHRLLKGEMSCSDYVKHVLIEQDLSSAIQLSVQRFRECKQASQSLQAQRAQGCIVIPCCIPI